MSLYLGVDHDALVKLAEQNFNGLRSTYESQDVLQPCRYTGSEVSTVHVQCSIIIIIIINFVLYAPASDRVQLHLHVV